MCRKSESIGIRLPKTGVEVPKRKGNGIDIPETGIKVPKPSVIGIALPKNRSGVTKQCPFRRRRVNIFSGYFSIK
ncbi:hypothetical protein JCM19039_4215 [Geomicrobium sp. JCM 19039]|nr:hypothetical protein JCM19039_4215 [Geomicrobium sp. JCM 19039]